MVDISAMLNFNLQHEKNGSRDRESTRSGAVILGVDCEAGPYEKPASIAS